MLIGAVGFGVSIDAHAQAWQPDKNVEIVLGVGPGGGVDTAARLIQKLWQNAAIVQAPTTIVNRTGGGGAVAWASVAQREGDAHVITFITPALITNHIGGRSPLSHADFTPIAHLGSEYLVFAVKADSAIRNGKDLIELLRKDASAVSVAVGSTLGGVLHLAMAQVIKAAGGEPKKLKAVVFKSSAESVTAMLGGHVDVMVNIPLNVLQHVKAGTVRLVAAAAPQRLGGLFSDVPTWKEQAIDVIGSNWRGVVAPKRLSSAQVAFWVGAFGKAVNTPEWQKELERTQYVGNFLAGAEHGRFLQAQATALRPVMVELGLAK
jgi:putative tricarboxylic transport membrane protein